MAEEKKKHWGGKRPGAGRKKKQTPEELAGIPLPNGDVIEIGASEHGCKPGNEYHTNPQYVEIREEADAAWNMSKTLRAPHDLDEVAKNEWTRLMKCFLKQNAEILSNLDMTMLRLFCESYSRYKSAYDTWKEDLQGKTVVSNDHAQRLIDKCLKIMHKETEVMKSLASDLGLTVSGRAKMGIFAAKAQKSKDEDAQAELSSFFSNL